MKIISWFTNSILNDGWKNCIRTNAPIVEQLFWKGKHRKRCRKWKKQLHDILNVRARWYCALWQFEYSFMIPYVRNASRAVFVRLAKTLFVNTQLRSGYDRRAGVPLRFAQFSPDYIRFGATKRNGKKTRIKNIDNKQDWIWFIIN